MMQLPTLYIGHGAPMLLDDELWTSQLHQIAMAIEKPKAILIVSAHWESAPVTLSTPIAGSPLVYDFSGFARKFLFERGDGAGFEDFFRHRASGLAALSRTF